MFQLTKSQKAVCSGNAVTDVAAIRPQSYLGELYSQDSFPKLYISDTRRGTRIRSHQ